MAKKKLSFEEAMTRMEEILVKLENEEVSLETSILLYKEAAALSADCQKQLLSYEQQVALLTRDLQGQIIETAFDRNQEEQNEF